MSKAKFKCFSIMFHALSTATNRLCLQFITACLEVLCLSNRVNDQELSSIELCKVKWIFLIRLSKMTGNLYS